MRHKLSDREQLEAAKMAGNILVSDRCKREKLLEKVPENFVEYVNEVIEHHDDIEIRRLSEEIVKLKTREYRNKALQNIPFHIRRIVKERVIEFFERGRNNGMD